MKFGTDADMRQFVRSYFRLAKGNEFKKFLFSLFEEFQLEVIGKLTDLLKIFLLSSYKISRNLSD